MVDAVALVQVSSLELILFSPYFIIDEYLTCYCLKICLNSPWHLSGYKVKLFPVCTEKDREIRLQYIDTQSVVPVECLVLYMKVAFCSAWGLTDYAHTVAVLGTENI
jgi:hypothetical protein